MSKIAFFSSQAYDKEYFKNANCQHIFEFFETPLEPKTVNLAKGFDGVCVFVNDHLDAEVIGLLKEAGIGLIALRCAGFNNVDLDAAKNHEIRVMRVPSYSPESVAEHTLAIIMTLARKTHKAYNRVREGNFSLVNLDGMLLHGKTMGVIGTGKIGRAFCQIALGLGMKVLANDKYPSEDLSGVNYVDLDELLYQSDVISLQCPLTPETHHLINKNTLGKMKKGCMLINTSRGKLIDTAAAIEALKIGQLGALGIDVYEEEEHLFFRDLSEQIIQDDHISRLIAFPNVLITAHQAFFTSESMQEIVKTTINNIDKFETKQISENDVNIELLT
ncbi:MAG: 2-hydroxyacid dehydrogenase [Cyclobacteriaceae bacterium]|nr:2-hydroxyacid dehydrogenase [Cyclobacteriaceae bacterium]MCH8515269.1 2-hydroxyacid dehydrogenase [Cyclobacteriaceae bacterium]